MYQSLIELISDIGLSGINCCEFWYQSLIELISDIVAAHYNVFLFLVSISYRVNF